MESVRGRRQWPWFGKQKALPQVAAQGAQGIGLGLGLGWGPQGMWMGLILGLTAAAVLLAARFQRSSKRLLDVRR